MGEFKVTKHAEDRWSQRFGNAAGGVTEALERAVLLTTNRIMGWVRASGGKWNICVSDGVYFYDSLFEAVLVCAADTKTVVTVLFAPERWRHPRHRPSPSDDSDESSDPSRPVRMKRVGGR